MKSLSAVLNQNFDFNLSDWQKLLKQELKTDQIDNKITKKYSDIGTWPILSLDNLKINQLRSSEPWKKASQTYFSPPTDGSLKEDIDNGVRVFFFNSYGGFNVSTEQLEKYLDSDCEVYCLNQAMARGGKKFKSFTEKDLLIARQIQDGGGSSTLELAWLAKEMTEHLAAEEWRVGVFLGSDIFRTIAKIRALRLLALKIQQEAQTTIPVKIIGLNSYRDWSVFEGYSNILRNDAQVMAAYLGGADIVQSSGYFSVSEIETDSKEIEHQVRSLRMARNTCHILALESMLGIVEDSASGSFHLEGLTQKYAETSWNLMQEILKTSDKLKFLSQRIDENRNYKTERIKFRKDIMAGTNDFPDVKEKLDIKLNPKFYRSAFTFEQLRIRVNHIKKLPKVEIHLKGSYAELSSRINFIKNYFEVIGLEVIDPLALLQSQKENIVVLCAKDEDYIDFVKSINLENNFQTYLAGKAEIKGLLNIYSGQNVYEILEKLVQRLEANS